jgi:hypothetical protein
METETVVNGAEGARLTEKVADAIATTKAKKAKSESKLKGKDPKTAEPTKPKIVVSGKAGVGKTYTALTFPSSYYIDTEGGASRDHYTERLKQAGGAYMGPEDGSLDGPTVIEQFKALATEEHDYKTVVIDSLSKIFNQIIADEAFRLGDKDGFGASKKPALAWIRQLLSWTSKLDMNVFFICHEKDEYSGSGNNREVIGQTFDCWDKLSFELDLTLQIQKRGTSRVAIPRKSRLLGFPENEAFPWTYEEFAKRYGKDVIERETKTIELATPESVAEVARLLEIVKIPETKIAKWLTDTKSETFADMSTAQIAKVINHLKEQVK